LPVDPAMIIAVFVLAMTGEILIAIPFGVFALRMDPALAFLIAYPGNLVPMILLLALFGYLDKRFPRLFNYFAKRSEKYQKRLQGKFGLVFLFLIIPITGVYGASTASGLLRIDKKRSFLVQSAALAFFGAVEVVAIYTGIGVITG
jgi:uncharacterized membrane protein